MSDASEKANRERYVIGSGASVQFMPDGSLAVSVSAIGKQPDANHNMIVYSNPRQALSFVRWLTDRVCIDDIDGWLETCAEKMLSTCGVVGRPEVACRTCGKTKAPVGRSVALETATSYCDDDCPGYRQEPKPDPLWPGEVCAPPLCPHGRNR